MKWILILALVPLVSWIIMLFVTFILKIHTEDLCFHSGFGIWLSSLLTAYGFFLYNLMRGQYDKSY